MSGSPARWPRLSVARFAFAAILSVAPATAAAGPVPADWPGFLGPSGDLRVETRDAPSGDETSGLRVRWKRPLGSGYSGIAISSGLLYTMFSDGTDDLVVCLDAATGEERWRHAIAPTWRGVQGSKDGPMSTPAVAGALVVGLGPRGHLVALDRMTGELRWRVNLVDSLRAEVPLYGFASSPLIDFDGEEGGEPGRVVIQAGGRPDASIVALDLATGRVAWTAGSEPVEYQSATEMSLSGRQQLIGITNTRLRGIDSRSGKVLWSERYLERPENAGSHAIPTGPNRFLVNTRTGATHYELEETLLGFALRERWTSRELKQTYAIPIFHKGHIYGYSGEFLTCIDAETGKRVWKSRPPGKGALLLLNDRLIAWSITGSLVAIDASPTGYRERARLQVMELGSITNPSFARGSVYVRNHEEIAAVAFTRTGKGIPPPEAATEPLPESSPWTNFLERLDQADNKKPLINAFMSEQPSFPIVEGDDLVHFVYRGRARDLAVYVGSASRQGADEMQRVPGTDLWYRSYRLAPGGRYDYQFQLNFDRLIGDPLNPRRAPSPGEFSELAMPRWHEPETLEPPKAGVGRGILEDLEFESKTSRNTRKIRVYLPPGYAESKKRYPLLIVNGGDEALEFGAMDRVLDNVIGRGVQPLVVAFVTYHRGRTWGETGGPHGERYAWMVANELDRFLGRRYRILSGRENRAIMGTGLSGYASLLAALRSPEAFGKVATQSLYTHNRPVADGLAALIEDPGEARLRIYMDWCDRDMVDPGEGLDLRRDNKRLAGLLQAAGHEMSVHEIASGPGWGTWRYRTAVILRTLFPAAGAP